MPTLLKLNHILVMIILRGSKSVDFIPSEVFELD